ncbi:MAG: gamma-glutamyl-gamma-aminobutyrate hydrolase family protein [Solobacterium sp.]|nr:gamma-glutamyl-gamma-aminobutyrate hydrolase family protein [Solobacterium sp.]
MTAIIGATSHPDLTGKYAMMTHTVSDTYISSVFRAGGTAVILPFTADEDSIRKYAEMIDGLLVPGGIDVNPLLYNEEPHPLLETTNMTFDRFEIALIREVMKLKKPVFGICRGHQIINVALGGTLWQDMSLQSPETFRHRQVEMGRAAVSHKVSIWPGTLLHEILGDEIMVNSFHHQAIKKPADCLRITAQASDGTIEAAEAADYPYLLTVQWHPESFVDISGHPMHRLFERFVQEAEKYAAQK